ncbi:MAG: hypothetical protein VX696_02700 [Pseudomonadota bacterium]|nr:hypothetical protein [Pseudomonadota bacterium]
MDWSADTDGNRFTLNDLINRGIEQMVADKKYPAEAKKVEATRNRHQMSGCTKFNNDAINNVDKRFRPLLLK